MQFYFGIPCVRVGPIEGKKIAGFPLRRERRARQDGSMTRWVKVCGGIVLVWAVAGCVILWSRAARPTAASFSEYLTAHPLAGRTTPERAQIIRKAATQLNRLDFKEREALRRQRRDRQFFEQMTPEERKEFLDLTLPEGFRQLMLALNAMSPEERRRVVNRAMRGIERDQPEMAGRIPEEEIKKVIAQGLGSFYDEANADVKLDFAPVIERLQQTVQKVR